MSNFATFTRFGLGVFIGYLAFEIYLLYKIPPLPILEDTWWGPGDGNSSEEDTSIKPFKINIPEKVSLTLYCC